MAHYEVFILNYNGARFLPMALVALEAIDRSEHRLEINVIDNGSSDDSRQIVENDYPWARFIELGKNLGFSAGNNKGVTIRLAELSKNGEHPDYLVFLNNDTSVDKNWLNGANSVFSADQNVGIVGSKSLFLDRFAKFRIETTPTYRPSDDGLPDPRELGIFLHNEIAGENIHPEPQRSKLLGAYPKELNGCWLGGGAEYFLPIKDHTMPSSGILAFSNNRHDRVDVRLQIFLEPTNELVVDKIIPAGKTSHAHIILKSKDYVNVIQNAGSYITKNWEGGDCGFLEIDEGQFDSPRTLDAVCGVSMFIKCNLFEKLGGFDEQYFAYYEDTDLSIRARLLGYKCVYSPSSLLRHIHCGSGVEHSEYFNTNVSWSQMIFWSKVMGKKEWKEKLNWYRDEAKRQFVDYSKDLSLDGKPQLRAYCRYLKHQIRFLNNRAFATKNNMSKLLTEQS